MMSPPDIQPTHGRAQGSRLENPGLNDERQTAMAIPQNGLSEQERLNRICGLLSKAVVRDWSGRVVTPVTAGETPGERSPVPAETSDRARILSYLELIGDASPAAIRGTLGLPRMRVYRAMQPLLASGRIVAQGQTRTITYRLSPTAAAKAALN